MQKVNIILPCAGLGTRLGLPYPKETHMIAENTALIDLTFNYLKQYKHLIGAITVIVAPEKGILLKHLSKWSSDFYIRFCYFNENYHEWAGSILSSEPDFHEKNIVFLPDSYLKEKPDSPLIESFIKLLETHSAAFACKAEDNPETIKNLGALKVCDKQVVAFCDKPTPPAAGYNAFWCSFAFQRSVGRPLLEMMTASIQRNAVDIQKVAPNSAAIFVEEYKDLGVWPNLREFINSDLTRKPA